MDKSQLYFGDNLDILRKYVPDSSVDLIYLDPPFNSQRNYNVIFKSDKGKEAEAQISAFLDTWNWDRTAQDTYDELVQSSSNNVSKMIDAMRLFVGANQTMAYLVMMTI